MYERIDTYNGSTRLQALADRLGLHAINWSSTGYGTAPGVLGAFRDELQSSIPGEWARAMFVVMQPGGTIPSHVDDQYEERYHLVLQTNEDCWHFHDGDWQQLELGGVYRVNPLKRHGSINWGTSQRIHLVVDVVPSMVAV